MRLSRSALPLPACAVPALLAVFESDVATFERHEDGALAADRATGRTLATMARALIEQVRTTGAVDLWSADARRYFADALRHGASEALHAGRWADVRSFATVAGLVEAKG